MQLISKLKEKGFRLTKPRQEIIKVLTGYPVSAQEIFDLIKQKHIRIDLASVYRTLDLFVKMGIVHVIDLGQNEKRYELVDENNHHHHLICIMCKLVTDVKFDEKDLLLNIQKKSQFLIDHHHLEIFGYCQSCQQLLNKKTEK